MSLDCLSCVDYYYIHITLYYLQGN